MGVSISGLVAGSVLNETDVFEIEQAGVSKKITKAQFRKLMFSDPAFAVPVALPQNGDAVSYNGTDFVTGAVPRWRVINIAAYTEGAVATSSQITFAGGVPASGIRLNGGDYFSVGSPVRVVIGATTYYGICTAVTDILLTISGAILPTSTAIVSLSVGTSDMVKHVQMRFPAVTYNASASDVLPRGCIHRWHGVTGYLVAYSCSHMNTSGTTVVNLQMNGGSNVSSTGVIPAAGTSTTHGVFVDSALGTLGVADTTIAHNQTITAKTPTVGGTADFLVVCMTFVVP